MPGGRYVLSKKYKERRKRLAVVISCNPLFSPYLVRLHRHSVLICQSSIFHYFLQYKLQDAKTKKMIKGHYYGIFVVSTICFVI